MQNANRRNTNLFNAIIRNTSSYVNIAFSIHIKYTQWWLRYHSKGLWKGFWFSTFIFLWNALFDKKLQIIKNNVNVYHELISKIVVHWSKGIIY